MKRIRGLIGILLTTLMLCSCSGRTNDFFDENFINNALYYDRSEVNHNLKIFALCSKIKKIQNLNDAEISLYPTRFLSISNSNEEDARYYTIGVISFNNKGDIIAYNENLITFPDFTLNTNTYYYMMNDKLLRYTDPYTVHIDREFFSENGSLHFFRDYKKEVYKKDLKYWLTHSTIGYKSDFVIENDVVTFSKRLPTSNPIFK